VRLLCAAVGARASDAGTAGLKDKHAVTRQWISLPPPVTPEAARAATIPGLTVLAATRHANKLRTGHLRGNRFTLVVRELAVPAVEALRRAQAVLERLARPPGVPAWYAEQRFGRDGETAALGRALVRGERVRGGPRERRLYVSAWQSELFNRYLDARLADGLHDRVLPGDLLRKTDSGGVFASEDPAAEQERLERGELCPTGPMPGARMRQPAEGTAAREREDALLASEGVTLADLARVASLAEGTRRPLAFPLGAASARALGHREDGAQGDDGDDGALELAFSLPAGSYATVVAAEVMKS
jgi:tRNA pseudouridine13 synthase